MTERLRACTVIPVFDHAATVADVVRGAAQHCPLVVVVDDGSTDGSGEAARTAASDVAAAGAVLEVVRLARNEGKGAALVAGFRRAAEAGFTHAVTLDADGQHRPSDIPALLAAAEADRSAIVVGARRLAGERVPRSSHVGRFVSNFWTLRTTGFDLPDTQCGFRVYPVAETLALGDLARRYDYEVEVLVRGAWAGLALRSVPIDVWYPPRSERISHLRPLVDNVRISWTYTRLALRRLVPTRAARSSASSAKKPRMGIRAGLRWLREQSAAGTRPAELALAVGAGAFIGATPFFGLHGILAVYVSSRWHLNLVAAFLGSNVSLPFLEPFLFLASVECGHLLLRGEFAALDVETIRTLGLRDFLMEYGRDYLVGSFAVAVLAGAVLGLSTLALAALVRRRAA